MNASKAPLFPIYDIMEHWAAFAKATPEVKPIHHALYHALVQMCKRRGGTQRFALPYLDGMEACSVHSRATYVAALRELEAWGFASYTPGANAIKPPIVGVNFCASAEHQLAIYRSSTLSPADASAEHILKEVKRLKEENDERAASLAEAEQALAALKAELAALKAQPPKPAPPAAAHPAALLTDPADEQAWHESPLTKPAAFRAICADLGHGNADVEHYRLLLLDIARNEAPQKNRTASQWRGFVRNCLTNQLKHGPLLLPQPDPARTGVNAPQAPDAYRYEITPEAAADEAARENARRSRLLAANQARVAASMNPGAPTAQA